MDDIMTDHYDQPWKAIIEKYFQPFMEFLFPHIAKEIDWEKGFEFLDSELAKIQRMAKVGKRTVDKLVKVYLKNGKEQWLLLHIEIQQNRKNHFPKTMFEYHYRIYNRYQIHPISLAVLSDKHPHWRPDSYDFKSLGTRLTLEYSVVKLLDYRNKMDILDKSKNPIAKVIKAHLQSLKKY